MTPPMNHDDLIKFFTQHFNAAEWSDSLYTMNHEEILETLRSPEIAMAIHLGLIGESWPLEQYRNMGEIHERAGREWPSGNPDLTHRKTPGPG